MREGEQQENAAEELSDATPLRIGDDGAASAEAPTVELEVLGAEVVDPRDPRAGEGLVLAEPLPSDLRPVLVYLASLSEGSRRTMRTSLENIARFISSGHADALTLAWHELRYQHTTYIRSTLAQAYKPATANKMLSALRGVLKECFRLGYISAEDYQRARDLPAIKGSALAALRQSSDAAQAHVLGDARGGCLGRFPTHIGAERLAEGPRGTDRESQA